MLQTRVTSLFTSTELALCLIMSVWVIIQCSDQYEWPLCSQRWDAAVANSVGFWHVLSVWLFHMGNTAPSGIVLYPGYRRRSICEWAPVCGRLHLMVIFSTYTIKMPQFGEMWRNLVACSIVLLLSCLLSLSLASSTLFLLYFSLFFQMFGPFSHPYAASNYTVSRRYYWTHDRMMDPRQRPLIHDFILTWDTGSKGLQSHQILERKSLMHHLNQCAGMSRWLKKDRLRFGVPCHKNAHLHTNTLSLAPSSHRPWACPSTWSWHVPSTLHETVAFLPLVCHLLPIS